jgi:NAD(P)-dependent dehydrogenase (short-subunit alcohol dehydrogenase family)
MAVNVKAPYFLTAALVPAMAENGRGVVLNLGSWGARLGTPAGTAYASTKGAMETLTRAWAAEFGPRGVRVNAISPGVTFDGANPVAKIAEPMMGTTPLGRLVAPDAIARRRRVPGQRRRRRCPRHRLGRRWRAVIRAFRGSMTKLTAKDAATRQHTSSAAGVSREVGLGEAMHDGTDRSPKVRAAYPAGLCA